MVRQTAEWLAHHNARPGQRGLRDQRDVTVTLGGLTGSNR